MSSDYILTKTGLHYVIQQTMIGIEVFEFHLIVISTKVLTN